MVKTGVGVWAMFGVKRSAAALALAVVVAGVSANQASADAIEFNATMHFTPIGSGANFSWDVDPKNISQGQIHPIATADVPNVLVHFDDPGLAYLGDLPATMFVSGYYQGQLGSGISPAGNALALAVFAFSFFYDGANDLHVGSRTLSTGGLLYATANPYIWVSAPTLGGGRYCCNYLATDLLKLPGDIRGDADLTVDPPPVAAGFTTDRYGFQHPFMNPGEGRISGSFFKSFALPEPSQWALLLIGFGFVGSGLRRCRRRSRLSANSVQLSPEAANSRA